MSKINWHFEISLTSSFRVSTGKECDARCRVALAKFWQARCTRVLKRTRFLDPGSTIRKPDLTGHDNPFPPSNCDRDGQEKLVQSWRWSKMSISTGSSTTIWGPSQGDASNDFAVLSWRRRTKFDRDEDCERVLRSWTRSSASDCNNDRKQAGQLRRELHDSLRRSRWGSQTSTLITNTIKYVDHDNARKRASRRWRGLLDDILSIVMRIASEYIDRDESRERAGSVATMFATNHTSSNATRVAMNSFMFDCEEGRHKRTTSSNAKTRTKCNQRSKEACTFGLLGLIGFARAHQSLAEEVKKESTIN